MEDEIVIIIGLCQNCLKRYVKPTIQELCPDCYPTDSNKSTPSLAAISPHPLAQS